MRTATAPHIELGCLQHHSANRRSMKSLASEIIAGGRADSSRRGLHMSARAIRAITPRLRGLVSAQGSIARCTNSFAQHLQVNGEDACLMNCDVTQLSMMHRVESGVAQRSAVLRANKFTAELRSGGQKVGRTAASQGICDSFRSKRQSCWKEAVPPFGLVTFFGENRPKTDFISKISIEEKSPKARSSQNRKSNDPSKNGKCATGGKPEIEEDPPRTTFITKAEIEDDRPKGVHVRPTICRQKI